MLTAEQIEQRRHGIGASEIASVVLAAVGERGLNPWEDVWDLWTKKVYGDAFAGNDATELGNCLEDGVARFYAHKHPGVWLAESKTLVHPEYPWAMATPDRFVFTDPPGPIRPAPNRLLEVKTGLDQIGEWGDDGTDEIPERYICQTQWQMFVAGARGGVPFTRCDVAALVAGEPRFYVVERNDDLIAFLLERGRWFMGLLERGEMPPIDGSSACTAELARRFPRNEKLTREASAAELSLMDRLAYARAVTKTTEEQAKKLSNELVLSAEGHRLTWPGEPKRYGQPQKTGGGERIDLAKLRAEYPEAAKACAVQGEASICFRTYEPKEKKA